MAQPKTVHTSPGWSMVSLPHPPLTPIQRHTVHEQTSSFLASTYLIFEYLKYKASVVAVKDQGKCSISPMLAMETLAVDVSQNPGLPSA